MEGNACHFVNELFIWAITCFSGGRTHLLETSNLYWRKTCRKSTALQWHFTSVALLHCEIELIAAPNIFMHDFMCVLYFFVGWGCISLKCATPKCASSGNSCEQVQSELAGSQPAISGYWWPGPVGADRFCLRTTFATFGGRESFLQNSFLRPSANSLETYHADATTYADAAILLSDVNWTNLGKI